MHRYTDTETRVYINARMNGHTTPLIAEPGMDPVQFDEVPADGRWEQVEEPKRAAKAPTTAKAVEE